MMKCINEKCNFIGEMDIRESGPHKGYYCPKCNKWQGQWIKQNNLKTKEINNMFEFKVNHEEAFEGNDLIPEGNWEVIVKEAKESETKSGRKNISIQLAIRNDLNQKYKNKIIFDTIWTKKDDNETYNMGNLQTVAKALDIPNGKGYNSLQELLRDWMGKGAKVYVQHETYQEKTNARVKGWAKTDAPGINHVWKVEKESISNNSDFVAADPQDFGDVPF